MSKARRIASCLELAAACARDARLLLGAESRNAAYLASQAAEHVMTAVATSEDVHIERRDAHQLDTILRRIPVDNADRAALATVAFLEAYATSYRYGSPTGRVSPSPTTERIEVALERIDDLIAILRRHFAVDPSDGAVANNTAPRRASGT